MGESPFVLQRGELSMTRLDYLQAAQHFKIAAALVEDSDVALRMRRAYRVSNGGVDLKKGKCPMCFCEKEIIESHLMSSALYGLCDAPDAGAVLVSSKLILMGARELKHPLLCDDCDNGLSTGGESWLLPLLAKIDGTFPFYDILVKVSPDAVERDSALYAAAKNPEI